MVQYFFVRELGALNIIKSMDQLLAASPQHKYAVFKIQLAQIHCCVT